MSMELKKINKENDRESVRIVYFGGAWSTNIGNSFIDLGSMQALKMACPDSIIYFVSEMPKWIFYFNKENLSNAFELATTIKADYAVFSGMMLGDDFIKVRGPTISKLIKNNIKIIINGGGGGTYMKKSVIDIVSIFFKKCPPYAFISRDERAFENYNGLAEYSYNGIDCGFFLSDYFTPAKLNLPDYVIFNFDEFMSHRLLKLIRNKLLFKPKIQIPKISNELIIRTHHSSWPNIPKNHFSKSNTLISDIPDDYLHLYANTKATYSDRVHACVATLSFGNPARLFSQTPRAHLFNKIGANTIREELTYPNVQKIREEKSKHIMFLSEVIK